MVTLSNKLNISVILGRRTRFHISPFSFISDLQEFMQYGSIPMQSSHTKQNYAAYLSNNFPMVII